ncbi:MAG: YceI family protein [Saprospiraceae bacterium]
MTRQVLLFALFSFWFTTLMDGQTIELLADKSTVQFKIKNGGFWVNGAFSDINLQGTFFPTEITKSQWSATLSVKSLDTGIKKRDTHLLSEDYFDADKYPSIKIVSKILKATQNGYILEGDLQIKDVKKAIVIPFRVEEQGDHFLLKGELTLNRIDYGVGEKSWLMNQNVTISIACAIKKTP